VCHYARRLRPKVKQATGKSSNGERRRRDNFRHENGYGARIGWCVLVAVTLAVCYFSNLGVIGFVGPDEPRYAWIARDMAESGDWIAPRLYGRPWFEKPVLYYWMAGASFKLFGVSEAAARLPSALCALFATLALAWLAWRVYGAENRALAFASAANKRRYDRFLARSRNRHAIQRNAHNRDGLRCRRAPLNAK